MPLGVARSVPRGRVQLGGARGADLQRPRGLATGQASPRLTGGVSQGQLEADVPTKMAWGAMPASRTRSALPEVEVD